MKINIGFIKVVDLEKRFGFITCFNSQRRGVDIYFKILSGKQFLRPFDVVIFEIEQNTHDDRNLKGVNVCSIKKISNPKLLLFLYLKSGNLQVLLRLNETFKEIGESRVHLLLAEFATPALSVIKSSHDFKVLRRFIRVISECRFVSDLFIQETLMTIISNLNNLKYLIILECSNLDIVQGEYYQLKEKLLGILKSLPKKVKSLIPLNALTIDFENVVGADVLSNSLSLDERASLFRYTIVDSHKKYNLYKLFFKNSSESYKEIINISFSPDFYFKAVGDGLVAIDSHGLVTLQGYLEGCSLYENTTIVERLSWQNSTELFSDDIVKDTYKALSVILSHAKTVETVKADDLISALSIEISYDVLLKLWLENLITKLSSRIVCTSFLIAEDRVFANKILERGKVAPVLTRAIEYLNKIEKFQRIKIYKNFFNSINDQCPEDIEKYTELVDIKSTYIQIWLWLEGHSKYFNFDSFKSDFILLSNDRQKSFLKKVFYEIKHNSVTLSVMQILELRNLLISPEIARDFPNTKVDTTVYVILQAIQDLSIGNIIKPNAIFNIIAEQIKSPEELLFLTGFFDKCRGRKIIDNSKGVDSEGLYTLKSERVPNNIIYCEGRHAIEKMNNSPAICEKTSTEFWWCKNSKCYQNCINIHTEWDKYTLIDFLEILNIEYNVADYEVLLGYINKVNNFLAHLKCRSCKQILKPISDNNTRNYGFDRVSHFCCYNDKCSEKSKSIYIIHCINGSCQGVIDSRDSVKCKPSELTDSQCGWYICNDCYACCNTVAIDRRRYVYNQTGQNYNGHLTGHKDRGVICCPKCGTETIPHGYNETEYKSALDWFISNRHNSRTIINSGTRKKDGKYWFILRASVDLEEFKKKLKNLMAMGFNVPDIELDKTEYLLGESFGQLDDTAIRLFSCPSCEFTIDMRDDFEKFISMKRYHINIEFSFK